MLPAYQIETIEKILAKPKINWQYVLKCYVGNVLGLYKKTKMRLSRREPLRFDLSEKIIDKTLKLVIALDTSASMTSDNIKHVMTEIFNIVKMKKCDITIIECDIKINNIYKVKKINDINLKVKGRGGTSFIPVINYINSNSYFRDAILIYFTDGYGDDYIPKPKTYRNLWVILNNETNLSLKNPYGRIIALNE